MFFDRTMTDMFDHPPLINFLNQWQRIIQVQQERVDEALYVPQMM